MQRKNLPSVVPCYRIVLERSGELYPPTARDMARIALRAMTDRPPDIIDDWADAIARDADG